MVAKSDIEKDLKEALKSGQKAQVSALRLILAAIKNAEIAKQSDLEEADVLAVIAKEAKKWEEAAAEYQKAGSQERADKEREDAAVAKKYLPAQLSEAEVQDIVAKVVAETGASSPRDMGTVMKEVMPRTKGRADGSVVSALVKRALAADDG
ncbi:MAG: GatB/YqeY domain-containing protein [Terriglobia bacterium]